MTILPFIMKGAHKTSYYNYRRLPAMTIITPVGTIAIETPGPDQARATFLQWRAALHQRAWRPVPTLLHTTTLIRVTLQRAQTRCASHTEDAKRKKAARSLQATVSIFVRVYLRRYNPPEDLTICAAGSILFDLRQEQVRFIVCQAGFTYSLVGRFITSRSIYTGLIQRR